MLHAVKPTKKTTYIPDREMPKLKCPSCKARLMDAGSIAVFRATRVFCYTGKEKVTYVIKCRACGENVGISDSKE